MQQPAAPRFLAEKLLRFFATPDPGEDVIAEAADLLDRTRLDVKWFLRDLFLSRYFFSPDCYRRRISSPAELVVGAVRVLRPRWPSTELANQMDAMGQSLLAPPTVKGWDGEKAWINSTTFAARAAFARALAALDDDNPLAADLDVARVVPADEKDPARVVGLLAEALLQGDLSADARDSLAGALLAADEGPAPDRFRDDDDFRKAKVREAIATLLGLPEAHAY